MNALRYKDVFMSLETESKIQFILSKRFLMPRFNLKIDASLYLRLSTCIEKISKDNQMQ